MRRRQFLILLAATVVVAPILVYGLRAHLTAAAESLPELIDLAPGNSTLIVYVDLAALRKEPLIVHLAESAAPVAVDRDYAEFASATGFDYRRDLDQVVIAASTGRTLAVADGRFDQEKIAQYVLRSGQLQQDGDRPLYVMKSTTAGQEYLANFSQQESDCDCGEC